ncbi:MAG: Hsp20/alpha crystallin family protein [Candidatus Eisenbacteria bacterium]
MMLTRWTPNGNLLNVHDEVHRLFNTAVSRREVRPLVPAGWLPAVDLHESAKDYTVEMELPGVNPKDVKVELVEGRLSIQGERKGVREGEDGATAHHVERVRGPFQRTFRLPARVDAGQVKASFKDGVLFVRVPKAPEALKQEIAIDVG